MPLENNIRHEQVNEIISNNPGFLVRNGIAIFIILLAGILCVCSFVKYPDVITAPAKLAAINAPKEIKTKLAARLIQLSATENIEVKQGDVLGYLESTANHQYIINLSKNIDNIAFEIQHTQVLQAISNLNKFINQCFVVSLLGNISIF